MAGEINEKCAVAAAVTVSTEVSAAALMYESLYAMQHRGTEASGIAGRSEDGPLESHSESGLVRDIYDEASMARLAGNIAIGHNRYSTSRSKKEEHCQPTVDKAIGLAFAHNGNEPTTDRLETFLSKRNISDSHATDSEMMGYAIAQYIRDGHDLPDAVEKAYPLFTGAFSCVAMRGDTAVAFRDPYGIRPLGIGTINDGHVATSETCGLDIIDASYKREVEPGEMVIITKGGIESRQLAEGTQKLDMFEFVYFARHDSQLYGQRVNEVRRRFGLQLALEHPPLPDDSDNVLVVPIPDTSIPAAEGYADSFGIRHKQAVIKNRYIGRTFMQPTPVHRSEQLRRKHNIIPEAVRGRDVVFIDDSIVRLNTMPRLVELAHLSGANSVAVLIASPPVRFPDFYGIDTPSQDELAAANMTIEEMRQKIGCKYLGFLSLSGLIEATHRPADMFNLSCFTGDYPIDIGERKNEIHQPISMEFVE